jgi:hypothetical protein
MELHLSVPVIYLSIKRGLYSRDEYGLAACENKFQMERKYLDTRNRNIVTKVCEST